MSVKYDQNNKRLRELRSAYDNLSQEVWDDFPITGPRTFMWAVQHMMVHGGSCAGWHQRWKAECKLTTQDPGVDSHELCCQTIQDMLTYDQLNGGNLASGERLAREIQLQEELYSHKVLGNKGSEWAEEKALFSGLGPKQRQNAAIHYQLPWQRVRVAPPSDASRPQ